MLLYKGHRFSAHDKFSIHFHWKQTSFLQFSNRIWDETTGSNQMIPGNTVSIQGLRPDITDMNFADLFKVKPDLQCVDCRMVLLAKI